MSEEFATVALVVARGAAPDALNAASATCDDFGVAWKYVEDAADSALLRNPAARWRAVIVASPDADRPQAWAVARKLPVIRVPSSDESSIKLELLWTGDGNLPGSTGEATFATMAIGEAGAKNAALFVVAMLALTDERLSGLWAAFRARQTRAVIDLPPLV